MSKAYDIPELCNSYCSGDCPIGKETVKPINADSLDRLILQFLGSSKKMEDISEQLIESMRPRLQLLMLSLRSWRRCL